MKRVSDFVEEYYDISPVNNPVARGMMVLDPRATPDLAEKVMLISVGIAKVGKKRAKTMHRLLDVREPYNLVQKAVLVGGSFSNKEEVGSLLLDTAIRVMIIPDPTEVDVDSELDLIESCQFDRRAYEQEQELSQIAPTQLE
jgi:hypothetical protein